jgi:hypothetical protein
MTESPQIVYVLTNPALPGLVKIGKTSRADVRSRMRELYSTGVPFPFDCAFACKVKDSAEVEQALHFALGRSRVNPNREFFDIEPERVIAILKLLKVDDVTTDIEKELDTDITTEEKASAEVAKGKRRPRLDYHDLDIPNDSVLVFKGRDDRVTITSNRKVSFEGQECSLASATRKILGLAEDYAIQPSPYWTYNGKLLRDIYNEVHGETE